MSPNPYWYRHEIRVSWVAFDGRLPKCALPTQVINYHENRPPLPKCVISLQRIDLPARRRERLSSAKSATSPPALVDRPAHPTTRTPKSVPPASSIAHAPSMLILEHSNPSTPLQTCRSLPHSLHAVDRLSQSPTRTRRFRGPRVVSNGRLGREGKGREYDAAQGQTPFMCGVQMSSYLQTVVTHC